MKINRLAKIRIVDSKTHHTLIAGLSGFGKGMFGEWYITKYLKKGYKVFDLHSESRGEGTLYGIKQSDSNLIKRMKHLSNGYIIPHDYKNEIVMFLGHNIKKIKKLPANIKVCVFNEKWITNEDLKNMVCNNEAQSSLIEGIFELHNDQHIRLTYLYDFLKRASNIASREGKSLKRIGAHYMSVNTIKRKCRALLRSGLFHKGEDMKEYFHYLNLAESLSEQNTITSFSTYLIEDSYLRYVCTNILLKKFIELIENRIYRIPILFYIREGNDFFYMKNPPPYVQDIQDSIEKILRKGRMLGGTQITVVLDTQLLGDLSDNVYNSFNKAVVFRLPVKDAKKLLYKATIPEDYLYKIANMDVGMFMYIAGGLFQYPVLAYPTLHKKADPNFDVFDYLGSKFGIKDYSKSLFLDLELLEAEKKSCEWQIEYAD